jgi:asparagine synthase (glutamine-hydrolysing)
LPSRFKIRDGREKYVVRKLAERLLPPEIATRRKQGLAYPKNAFSTPPTDRYVRELLLESASSPFDRSAVEREMPQLFRHEREASLKLYRLTMLQAWWNVYLA